MLPQKAEDLHTPCKVALRLAWANLSLSASLSDIFGDTGSRHLPPLRSAEMGSPHISCLRAVAMSTKWLWGGIVLSGRETVEAQPHSCWPWGRKETEEGARAWRPGSTTAGSFVNSGLAKAALPPPQQCPLCPEAQARDPLSGALTPDQGCSN